MGPAALAADRAMTAKRLVGMAVALEAEEEEMHSSLHPDVAAVLRGRRLLLWRALLRETTPGRIR